MTLTLLMLQASYQQSFSLCLCRKASILAALLCRLEWPSARTMYFDISLSRWHCTDWFALLSVLTSTFLAGHTIITLYNSPWLLTAWLSHLQTDCPLLNIFCCTTEWREKGEKQLTSSILKHVLGRASQAGSGFRKTWVLRKPISSLKLHLSVHTVAVHRCPCRLLPMQH